MNKYVKITLKVLFSLITLAAVALGALVIYVKYFYGYSETAISYYADEMPISKEQFQEEFNEIHRKTLDMYSLYESKGLDMDSLYRTFGVRVEQAGDATEFGRILKEYFASLKVGHAQVYLQDYTAAYSPRYIEGRIFIAGPNAYLTEQGFEDKDEIIALNGTATAEWIRNHEKFTPASTEAYRRMMTAMNAFRSWGDSIVAYTVARQQDTLNIELALKKRAFFQAETVSEPIVEWKILQDSVGYINILSMAGNVAEDFARAYEHVKSLPHLIVDVRENGGGNSGNGRLICEYLIREPQQHCVGEGQMMQPREDAYKGRLYLLTSAYTFSAAESFCIDMKESGNATLIGEPTAGDTGNMPLNFHTSGNIYFRLPTRDPAFSPQGFPMEGTGIPPHIQIHQTADDFMKGRDTVLDLSLMIIERQNV